MLLALTRLLRKYLARPYTGTFSETYNLYGLLSDTK